jgi:hypothetical protein
MRRYGVKKGPVLIALVVLMLSLIIAVGCGDEKTNTVSTSAGDVAVTDNNGSTGTVVTSDKAPSEAELGAPIYPGATYVPGTGKRSKEVSTLEGTFTTCGAGYSTTDSFSKVVKWYTGKLGAPVTSAAEEAAWPSSSVGKPEVNVIMKDGKVIIVIANVFQK